MENIERMKPSQTYEVMDLWLRTTIHSNSFVEENFWETHYDFVKEKYINGKENFVYIIDGKIVAFTGVTEDNGAFRRSRISKQRYRNGTYKFPEIGVQYAPHTYLRKKQKGSCIRNPYRLYH